MSRSTWIFLIFLLLINIVPNISKGEKFTFDHAKNEGYIAFIVNEKDNSNQNDTTEKCKCNGTEVMVHGDGHKTPCQCLTTGDRKCKCDNKELQLIKDIVVPQVVVPKIEPIQPAQQQQNDNDGRRRLFRRR